MTLLKGRRWATTGILALCGASVAFVDNAAWADDIDIGDVIVSGGRTPVDAQSFARANTIITGEELEQRQVTTVADALRQVPGLHVSRTGGAGGTTAVRIRGSEANHVLVLIDGVETADSSDGFEFADLTAAQIERIEVLRGPQSALYGAGATAGVINIITRGGIRNAQRAEVTVEGGSAPYKALSGIVQLGNDFADMGLSVSFQDDEGYDAADDGGEKDGLENFVINLRGSVDVTPELSFRGTARYTDRETEFDETAFGCGDPDCYVFNFASETEGEDLLLSLAADWETFGGALVHTPSISFAADENESIGQFGPSSNDASTLKAGYQAALTFGSNDQHTVVGAFDFKREKFKSSFAGGDTKDRDQLGYVLEYRGNLTDDFFVQVGGRFDDNEDFDDAIAWSVSASYAFPQTGTRIHGAIGQAQTNPTFFEQFGFIPGTFTGNPDLEPEENFGWDIGVEQAFWEGRVLIDVTYFNETLTDEISGFGASVVNLDGDSERQGVEVSLNLRPVDGLAVGASYTYLEASEPDGSEEVRRPQHSAGVNAAYTFYEERATVGADVTYFGDNVQRDFSDDSFTSPKVDVDGYLVVDLNASFEVTENVSIIGKVENAFDNDYQEVLGFGSQPLAATVGLKVKF